MLSYKVPGFTYAVEEMSTEEREWFVRRLHKQLKDEESAIKRATKRKR